MAGGHREVAEIVACKKIPEGHRQLLHLHAALRKTVDQEARGAQILPAGYSSGDPH